MVGPESGDELGGQRTGAAADVEHPLARSDTGEVGELRRQLPGVAPHEAVVRLSGDIKAHKANCIEVRWGCRRRLNRILREAYSISRRS